MKIKKWRPRDGKSKRSDRGTRLWHEGMGEKYEGVTIRDIGRGRHVKNCKTIGGNHYANKKRDQGLPKKGNKDYLMSYLIPREVFRLPA